MRRWFFLPSIELVRIPSQSLSLKNLHRTGHNSYGPIIFVKLMCSFFFKTELVKVLPHALIKEKIARLNRTPLKEENVQL